MKTPVRVRFAPSPTGPLHIGGVRTALYNYLLAKKHKGSFILRIEDTDQSRYVEGAESYIQNALDWCGLSVDEGPSTGGSYGPYRQSERQAVYGEYIQKLIDTGHAYYAFDTQDQLDQYRKDHEAKGKTFIYNWHNRNKLDNSLSLSEDELQQKIASGMPYVIRYKCPVDEQLHLHDEVRGDIRIESNILDDKVLYKSDGMPTYHFANVVDDHLMKITHVIRGEEWLPSLALHVLLYRSFGWDAPSFAHLPLILKPVGQGKLSKRDGDKMGFPVFPLEWTDPTSGQTSAGYREQGYFPEAVINMLALLGWSPGDDRELFTLEELVNTFEMERVNTSGAKFDPEKTKWFQQQYMHQLSDDELLEKVRRMLEKESIQVPEQLNKIVLSVRERLIFVKDVLEETRFYFEPPKEFDPKAIKKAWKNETPALLEGLSEHYKKCTDFSQENIADTTKEWIASQDVGMGKVMMPLRIALVGSLQGPDVFEIISILGKEETLQRIAFSLEQISAST